MPLHQKLACFSQTRVQLSWKHCWISLTCLQDLVRSWSGKTQQLYKPRYLSRWGNVEMKWRTHHNYALWRKCFHTTFITCPVTNHNRLRHHTTSRFTAFAMQQDHCKQTNYLLQNLCTICHLHARTLLIPTKPDNQFKIQHKGTVK